MLAYEQIVAHAKKTPEKIAVYCNGQHYSYGWLNENSDSLALALLGQGVQRGDLIALCFSRSADYIVSILAVHKIGCAFLPINTDQPASRINTILDCAAIKYLITNDDSLGFSSVNVLAYAGLLAKQMTASSVLGPSEADPNALAYVIFTSGSSGLPKGVKIKQSSLAHLVENMRAVIGITETDCLFAQAAFHFDMSIADIYWPLTSGAAIFLPTQEALRHPQKTIELLNSKVITLLQGTPSWYRYMFMANWQPVKKYKILCGGEAFPLDLKKRLLAQASELWNMYGPTEATVWISALKINDSDQLVSLGSPFPGALFKVEAGELHIGGEQVADGYLGVNPDQNEKFYRDADSALPWYKTGDAVYQASGQMVFSGRIDRQIKINGLRVELGEIESVLLACEQITAAAVLMHEQPHPVLIAFVVSSLSQAELEKLVSTQCEQHLPAYMRVNHAVKIANMPLTSSNKTDYHRLKTLFEQEKMACGQNIPDASAPGQSADFQGIKQIWQRRLHLNHLEENRGFFDLGGTSLVAVQMMGDIKKQYGLDVSLDMFLLDSFDEFSKAVLKSVSAQRLEERFVVPLLAPKGVSKKLFFVHGIGGGVLNYKTLAAQLGDADVYGIQCRGLDGLSMPMNDIKRMAAVYIDAIKTVQAEGPYYLLGGSMGGVVAFEMACQLQNQGDPIAALVMFDSYPPGFYSKLDLSIRLNKTLEGFKRSSNGRSKEVFPFWDLGKMFSVFPFIARKIKTISDLFYIKLCQLFRLQLDQSRRYGLIHAVHLRALQNYKPSRIFCGDVFYFKAMGSPSDQQVDETAWSSYLDGRLSVQTLSGQHENLIENKDLPTSLRAVLSDQ